MATNIPLLYRCPVVLRTLQITAAIISGLIHGNELYIAGSAVEKTAQITVCRTIHPPYRIYESIKNRVDIAQHGLAASVAAVSNIVALINILTRGTSKILIAADLCVA